MQAYEQLEIRGSETMTSQRERLQKLEMVAEISRDVIVDFGETVVNYPNLFRLAQIIRLLEGDHAKNRT